MDENTTETDTPVETKVPFWKTPLFRKASIVVGATAGVIIATAVLASLGDDEEEDDQEELDSPVVDVTVIETADASK